MDRQSDAAVIPGSGATSTIEHASIEFLGRWQRLISTTNWEKGRIVFEWRTALVSAGAPVQEYSDEAWSRRAGAVSSQHVGRLRRVFERFGGVYSTYVRLYWSHFLAALDWDDAEMWLEGASQSQWSVSQMRRQRWEATGALAAEEPTDDVVVAELDEDVPPFESFAEETAEHATTRDEAEASDESDSYGDEPAPFDPDGEAEEGAGEPDLASISTTAVAEAAPFRELPELPDDLAEAVETLKLAIIRHKLSRWEQCSLEDVLVTLNALRQVAMSGSDA